MAYIQHRETGEIKAIGDTDIIPKEYKLYVGQVQVRADAGNKFDGKKNRLDLVHPVFTQSLGWVMTHGAKKYGDWNWYKGLAWSRVYGALQRHLHAWYEGEDIDDESNLSHLAHAAACLMFLLVYQHDGVGTDDRPAKT